MAHQPFGQMPWMEDTEAGLEIFESRAIVSCKPLLYIHLE
jgi:glutathione S-transferase